MEKEYLIREKPLKALLFFAFPMIIGNLFQQFYTMVDSVVVGRFVGVYIHCHWRRNGGFGADQPVFRRQKLQKNEDFCEHGTAFFSGGEHCAGRSGTSLGKRDHGTSEHAGEYYGGCHGISEYLFYWAAFPVYVYCVVIYVQRSGKIQDSAVSAYFFLGV